MRSLSAILILSFLACVFLALLPQEMALALLKEHGVIETASAVLPLITIGVLARFWRQSLDARLASVVLLLFSYREADWDFHKSFFTMNLTRMSDYGSPLFPLSEKIAALLVVLILGGLLGWLILRNARAFLQSLRLGYPPVLQIATALFLLITSEKISETLHHLLMQDALAIFFLATEEVFETAAQCLLLLAALGYGRNRDRGSRAWAK